MKSLIVSTLVLSLLCVSLAESATSVAEVTHSDFQAVDAGKYIYIIF